MITVPVSVPVTLPISKAVALAAGGGDPGGGAASSSTWSPTNKNAGFTLSGDKLTASTATNPGSASVGMATSSIASGDKRQFEILVSAISSQFGIGLANSSVGFTNGRWLGENANSVGYLSDGKVYAGGSQIGTVGVFGNGAVITVAVSSGKVWFRLNGGNWNGSPTDNPATGAGGFTHGVSGLLLPAYMLQYDGTTPASVTARFSSSAWGYAALSGFTQIP